jgi:hypothetical protein
MSLKTGYVVENGHWSYSSEMLKAKIPFSRLSKEDISSYFAKTEHQWLIWNWLVGAYIPPDSTSAGFLQKCSWFIELINSYETVTYEQGLEVLQTLYLLEALSGPQPKKPELVKSNAVALMRSLLESVLHNNQRQLQLVTLFCPDSDFEAGRLYDSPSAAKQLECQQLINCMQVLNYLSFKLDLTIIVANDWFHPAVRQNVADSSSGDPAIIERYCQSLEERLHGLMSAAGLESVNAHVVKATNLAGFGVYRSAVDEYRQKLSTGAPAILEAAISRAHKQTSLYYTTLQASDFDEVIADDQALFAATPLLWQENRENKSGTGRLALTFEPDSTSLERFWACQQVTIGVLNLDYHLIKERS